MKKIIFINDPVSGFIKIDKEIYLEIINHSYFQRLRRIRQLGLTDLVFPGATHTRFQHTLGAFQLMRDALDILKMKGVGISQEEEESALMAILLHDVGHGPFSHALEKEIVVNVNHERISNFFIEYFNVLTGEKLALSKEMFADNYSRKFFHSLISGQLDIDRLDYLRRDSFYCGVPEGMIGVERLIRMMNVTNEELVIDKKGIYTVENYLIARQSMYWQVYLHKAVIGAEQLLTKILQRAKLLTSMGLELPASPALKFFLYNNISEGDFFVQEVLDNFALLEDNDILLAIKMWMNSDDFILSHLCKNLMERKIPAIEVSDKPVKEDIIDYYKNKVKEKYCLQEEDCKYFVDTGIVQNTFYDIKNEPIKILLTNNSVVNYLSPLMGENALDLASLIQKYFLCYPKEFKEN